MSESMERQIDLQIMSLWRKGLLPDPANPPEMELEEVKNTPWVRKWVEDRMKGNNVENRTQASDSRPPGGR